MNFLRNPEIGPSNLNHLNWLKFDKVGGGVGGIPPQLRLGRNTSSPDPIGWAGCSRHTNRTGATIQTAFNPIWAHVPGTPAAPAEPEDPQIIQGSRFAEPSATELRVVFI